MLTKKEVISDLEYICKETGAQYLFYDDIHTMDSKKDVMKFWAVLKSVGYSVEDAVEDRFLLPEYGGGLKVEDWLEGDSRAYVMTGDNGKDFVCLAGVDSNREKNDIYHECGHLYQHKLKLFDWDDESSYSIYLREMHANTFASMVLLLKSKTVLEYKKQQLCRIGDNIDTINSTYAKNNIYYISLPIELELLRDIRKKGRKKVLKSFSKDGLLDFEKIALYTADFVKQHAYTQEEWAEFKDRKTSTYEYLKRKAKAWRILGEAYVACNEIKERNKICRYERIKQFKKKIFNEKIKPLETSDEESRVINAVCAIDVCRTELCQDWNYFEDLRHMIEHPNECCDENCEGISDEETRKSILSIKGKIITTYEEFKDEKLFIALFDKICDIKSRDKIWKLKEYKKRSKPYLFDMQKARILKQKSY